MEKQQSKNYATKKHGATEVQPLWNMADIKNVVDWFTEKEDWDGYLITLLELLLGRRIGDTISMKWSDLYWENGKRKEQINTIEEQKTGKVTTLHVSSMVFEAVDFYCEKTGTVPMEHLDEFIFEYPSKTLWVKRKRIHEELYRTVTPGTIERWEEALRKDISAAREQKILKAFYTQTRYKTFGEYLYEEIEWNEVAKWQGDVYRKKLKQASRDLGILTPVSTHSLRKTFGYWIYQMHMFDPNCLPTLQKLFSHADMNTTLIYIGVMEERKRRLLEDHGDFIRNVLAGKGDEIAKNMPVISLKTDDLLSIFRGLTDDIDKYQEAINRANEMRLS